MEKFDLKKLLKSGPVFLDGATGTNLMKAGMPIGVCPEKWISENPEAILNLQKAYVEAGTNILLAPTFTANRIKLSEYGSQDELVEINRTMVRLCREAAGDKAYVAGDMTMTGRQLYPTGDLQFEELVDVYKEQVRAILEEGVDLFIVETMMSLQECRAAVLAIKETCDLPIMVSLTYNEDGRTLFGSRPSTTMIVLQALGVDAVGLNCSSGPDAMIEPIREMRRYAKIPILAKPNAGLPELLDGETVYKMSPEEFAGQVKLLIDEGAAIVGGCCGTTPEHIKALVDLTFGKKILEPSPVVTRVVTSERMDCEIDVDGKFLVVGERINPTGKKALQAELREGSLDMVRTFARDQEAAGASILDVNMGTNGIDEKQMMIDAINEITYTVDLPLCIDTSYPEVMEAALRIYPGRALINSISAEDEKLKFMIPLAKKYGAMFILLPLNSEGLPKNFDEKKQNISRVLKAAEEAGLSKDDAVVDLLVATVGAEPEAAKNCFDTVEYCKANGLPTICGLSNISFGLPQRAFVNTAFLNIAIAKGLTMAIANPSQEMLMYTAFASDMLLCKEDAIERYLRTVPTGQITLTSGTAAKASSDTSSSKDESDPVDPVYDAVVKGDKGNIVKEAKKKIEAGMDASAIINDYLIPGINQVGKLYDEKKYFLPQLIAGANAMKEAMDYLEPMLVSDDSEQKETIVIATVEGDIHDIGKNLVALMLKNYGYKVIDLGKDIAAETIVNTAMEENAAIIGLSALMTTTMVRMKDVVELAKEKGCTAKIMVGGACITPSYADEIGADAYSLDAADAVRVAERLLG